MSFTITPKELKARIDKGDQLVLLDVREPWENQLARLDNSVLIPLGTLPCHCPNWIGRPRLSRTAIMACAAAMRPDSCFNRDFPT